MSEYAEISGVAAISAALDALVAATVAKAAVVVRRGQAIVENAAKQQFTQSHAPGTPTPSAPGQPPAVVTGTLRRSIVSDTPSPFGAWGVVGNVFPTVVYARIQELGGATHRGFLPPRPYMQPAFAGVHRTLLDIAVEEFALL